MDAVFEAICLPDAVRKEVAANKKLIPSLIDFVQTGGFLMFEAATLLSNPINTRAKSRFLTLRQAIVDRQLQTKDQIHAAVAALNSEQEPSADAFNEACGVGVDVTIDECDAYLASLVKQKLELVESERYKSLGQLLKLAKEDKRIKWADGKILKSALDRQLLARLGPVNAVKNAPAVKAAKISKKPASKDKTNALEATSSESFFKSGELGKLHKAGENPQINKSLMEKHLSETKGRVLTRFPPEPNGYLHIGHAKAININFGYAAANSGLCCLRYDDTNPEAEEEVYFNTILESVQWLGFEPSKITYSSDYFQELFDLAVGMTKKGNAYVCHCTGEEIHEQRGGDANGPRSQCPHRNRPIEESLREFERMRKGEYKSGEATLRMKMDMSNPNPQFWDLVAYRVMFVKHHRTSDNWVIYPTYDYTHCLCDSFENITHSLCTTEFQMSRESYYWLCDVLEVYKPVQWEYGRLNITNTVLSKRKLTQLVDKKIVRGWDDPRLFTLVALKRRGFPAPAINEFVRDCGVSTANSTIELSRLEYFVRQHLDESAPRVMALIEPIPVLLVNSKPDHYQEFDMPYMPKTKKLPDGLPSSHKLPFTNTLFIDAVDFKEDAAQDTNFFRLGVGCTVNLLGASYPIYCHKAMKDASGKIVALECAYLDPALKHPSYMTPMDSIPKAKAWIQWIAYSPPHAGHITSPQDAEIRVYNHLFKHANPMDKNEVPEGFLSDINPDSLEVHRGMLESGVIMDDTSKLLHLKEESVVQFSRIGYFCVDKDSKVSKAKVIRSLPVWNPDLGSVEMVEKTSECCSGWVMNRTVTLREDTKKDS